MPIRIAIVEDDPEVRDVLAWLFRNAPDFECVAACATGEEALQQIPPLRPDVLLLDIRLPGKSGLQCIGPIKQASPSTEITMLTVFEDEESIFQALSAGATGYLLKKTPPAGILEAVRDLHAGGSPISSQIARKLVEALAEPPARSRIAPALSVAQKGANDPAAALCARERQILDLLAEGYRYKEIANELGITIHTVRTFIRRMYEKLHVQSRMEAVNKVQPRSR